MFDTCFSQLVLFMFCFNPPFLNSISFSAFSYECYAILSQGPSMKKVVTYLLIIWEGVRSWSSLSAGRRHFSSARKKKLWCTKSIPNDIVECMDQGFYKKKSPDHLFQVIRWSGAVLTLCSPKKLQLTSVFSFSVLISFFLLFHSFVIAVLPSQWFSPCVHPCTPMLHLFGWHLKQVTVIPHNNIMPFFEYILSIFQVLLPDQPERSETNIKSKQPIYLPTILISGHKNAPVRRTWKMDKS